MANPASYAPHCATPSNVDLWIFDHVQSFAACREDRNLDAANYGRISDSGNSATFETQRRDDRNEAPDSRTRLELPTGGSVGRIDPLRDDPFHFQGAGMIVESPSAPDLVIVEMQRRAGTQQQSAKTFFPLRNRHRGDRFAIKVEEIEQEEDESAAVAGVRGVLDQAEGGGAVGPDAAQLAVEIGLSRRGALQVPQRSPGIYASSRARCGSEAGQRPGPAGHASDSRRI
jgi:hypothetical protein